jgi:hypothetical protein
MLIAHHEVAPVSRPKEKAARPRRVARISMPSALSVFRLMAGPMRSGLMSQLGVCTENLSSGVVVMKSAQDGK